MSLVSDLMFRYENYLRHEKRAADLTVAAYLSDLRVFGEWLDRDVESVVLDDMRAYLRHLSKSGRKYSTIERKFAGFSTFWQWLKMEKVVVDNPIDYITIPKKPRPLPVWLEAHQLRIFVQTIDPNPYWLRNHVAWSLMAWLALRRSEILRLKVGDLKLADQTISISQSKGGRSRVLPLPSPLCSLLKYASIARMPEDYLLMGELGGRWGLSSFQTQFAAHIQHCGLPKKITPHSIRHTTATQMMRRGVGIYVLKDFLGHADIKTTLIYLHINQESISTAMEMHPLNDLYTL